MVLIKIMKNKGETVVSLCDKELLGKVYKDEKYCLDLVKYKQFYEGESIEEYDDLKKALKSASSINAVGEKSIRILKRYGFEISNAKKIGKEKISHIQIYMI